MAPQVAPLLTPPLLGATAVAALLLVVVAYEAVGALVTLAHEGGHVTVNTLAGRTVDHFQVFKGGSGVTVSADRGWGRARILSSAAGYTTPPLLGLGGAALLARGAVRPLLWTAVVLLVLAVTKAEKEWTTFLVLLSATATGYTAIYGSAMLQAAIAAGLVWLMLFGGLRAAVESSTADKSDAAALARNTWIPRFAWKAAFVVVALYCLWKGFLLLAP
jgi:hypothetical protein